MTIANQCTVERNFLMKLSRTFYFHRLYIVHVNIYQLEKMIYFKYTLPLKWYIFLRCNFVKAHTFLRILEEILAEEIR